MGTKRSQKQRSYTAEERTAMVEGYHSGGLSQKRWCEENGVSQSTLNTWLHRKGQEPTAHFEQTWAPVAVEEVSQEKTLKVQAGKFSIAVEKSTDLELLTAVLKVVVELC